MPLISDGKAVFLRNSEGRRRSAWTERSSCSPSARRGGRRPDLLIHRHGGIALVLGLALGGVLGSLLAWRVGVWLEPDRDVSSPMPEQSGPNVDFQAPLELNMAAAACWPGRSPR